MMSSSAEGILAWVGERRRAKAEESLEERFTP
jgi:hypothetical protein